MPRQVESRPGVYLDSVTLMQVSRDIGAIDGVRAALVAMATELNLDLLGGMGFTAPDGAAATDLLVAIDASDDTTLAQALAAVESALTTRTSSPSGPGFGDGSGGGFGAAPAPRTVRSAMNQSGGTLALVSTPGRYAFLDAMDALEAHRSVVVFSDNVPIEQEIRLKDEAARRDLLVMGPDCGTAVIGGVGLGFANVVRPGPVGIVAASGTGAQQVMSLLDGAGVGISHCIGVGSRDLSSPVGGRTTLAALDLLADDDATEVIAVIGKPPAAEVADAVHQRAADLGKPVLVGLQGAGEPDLTTIAETLVTSLGRDWSEPRWWPAPTKRTGHYPYIRGLYSGGTLCDEAMLIASDTLGPIRSNIPLRTGWDVGLSLRADGHVMIDFGDDVLTAGRPHPMIDGTLRIERIRAEAADPGCGVLLLDVVLGHGAHPDPAADLAPAIAVAQSHAAADGRDLAVVVALVGTAGDPQSLERQAAALRDAGASVHLSNAAAARKAVELVKVEPSVPPHVWTSSHEFRSACGGRPMTSDLLGAAPSVVAAGVDLFAEALAAQAVATVSVDWRPPPAGTEDQLIRVAADPRRPEANATAVERMLRSTAELVDVRQAREALGLEPGHFLHAGPPMTWEQASGPMRGALMAAMMFEGLAETPDAAAARLGGESGITLEPCHHRGAVGPMAGVVSPSMWMFELRDEANDGTSWCSLNEGLGKVLRYGAYSPDVIDRLHWMTDVLGPLLQAAVRRRGRIDVKAIIAQMVQMGDEGHNRNRAGTMMLLRELLPDLISADAPSSTVAEIVRFVSGNDHFFLNLVMPAAKLQAAAEAGIPGSSVVTTMARNGTEFGIQVSGTGSTWFTAPAAVPDGLYLGSYGPGDANPDIGDSTIAETVGLGGFAMASAPAIVRFVGGTVRDALRTSQLMYQITLAENPAYAFPILDFRRAPTGIDVTLVLRTGILPQINTGMAGKVAGTGQVGAGLVQPPVECFTSALTALSHAAPPLASA